MGARRLPEINTRKDPRLSNAALARIANYEKGAAAFAKEHPDADMAVIERYITGYREVEMQNARETALHTAKNRELANQGEKLDDRVLHARNNQRIHEYKVDFNHSVTAPEERKTWEAYARKMQSPSVVGSALGQFASIPGLLGGAVGGWYIFNQMGGMGGGWLAVGAGLIAAIAGAWLANKATDAVSGIFTGKEKTPETEKSATPEKQRSVTPNEPSQTLETASAPQKPMAELLTPSVVTFNPQGSNPSEATLASVTPGSAVRVLPETDIKR